MILGEGGMEYKQTFSPYPLTILKIIPSPLKIEAFYKIDTVSTYPNIIQKHCDQQRGMFFPVLARILRKTNTYLNIGVTTFASSSNKKIKSQVRSTEYCSCIKIDECNTDEPLADT